MFSQSLLISFSLIFVNSIVFAAPPLPIGLQNPTTPIEPVLTENIQEPNLPLLDSIQGFWEFRTGIRTQDTPHQNDFSLAETRFNLEFQHQFNQVEVNLSADFIYDALTPTHNINLETGAGWLDLRTANISFSPFSALDLKIGRQILTWGTGDLVFINDLFPKDWNAFFLGRDVEYLKAPSDALKAAFFSEYVNLDLIFIPRFDADRSITGARLNYYNPQTHAIAGQNAIIKTHRPTDSEWALRLHKIIGVNELAIYAYQGFWKIPAGFDNFTNTAIYPDLRTLGASIRRPIFKGIANFEIGYFDSQDDADGNNPLIDNSELRVLAAYEQEVLQDLSVGMQYYLSWMQDYHAYTDNMPANMHQRDETRQVITARITWLTHEQNLSWSLFSFYSPTGNDAYLRPKISYKLNDNWQLDLGGNFFIGQQTSFFGQFQDNNNTYFATRFSF